METLREKASRPRAGHGADVAVICAPEVRFLEVEVGAEKDLPEIVAAYPQASVFMTAESESHGYAGV